MTDLFASNPSGNAAVIAESTAGPGSRVQLLAVTSNGRSEGQIQYRGTFSLVQVTAGDPARRARLVLLDNGEVTMWSKAKIVHPLGDAAVVAESTAGPGSRVQLLAVTSNGFSEGQIQYGGTFSLVQVTAGNPARRARLVLLDNGHINLNGVNGETRIVMDCNEGDIILKNADCAEDFDVAQGADIDPGTVSIIDENGTLRPCDRPYDTRVAGVASGAGGYRPGIVLDRHQSSNRRTAIGISGKVYCKVVAHESPIKVGDLLTTSHITGHAMKADDPLKAFGAVIGKALRSLPSGQGLIPILIALQ